MSYNVGIQTTEIVGKHWKSRKYKKLKADVQKVFAHASGMQIMFISEFGNMFDKAQNIYQIFSGMLDELQLTHLYLSLIHI